MWKMVEEKTLEGTEAFDRSLSTIITTEEDLEKNIDLFEEALQSACRRTSLNH
jgi:hypothetical protein